MPPHRLARMRMRRRLRTDSDVSLVVEGHTIIAASLWRIIFDFIYLCVQVCVTFFIRRFCSVLNSVSVFNKSINPIPDRQFLNELSETQMLIRYLFTFLPGEIHFDNEERFYASVFLPAWKLQLIKLISHLSLHIIPPVLRAEMAVYYYRLRKATEFFVSSVLVDQCEQIIILRAGYDTSAYRYRSLRMQKNDVNDESAGSRKSSNRNELSKKEIIKNKRINNNSFSGDERNKCELIKKNSSENEQNSESINRNDHQTGPLIFEIDRNDILTKKKNNLNKYCSLKKLKKIQRGVSYISCDFSDSDINTMSSKLLFHGFKPYAKTAVLAEGLASVVPEESLKSILDQIRFACLGIPFNDLSESNCDSILVSLQKRRKEEQVRGSESPEVVIFFDYMELETSLLSRWTQKLNNKFEHYEYPNGYLESRIQNEWHATILEKNNSTAEMIECFEKSNLRSFLSAIFVSGMRQSYCCLTCQLDCWSILKMGSQK